MSTDKGTTERVMIDPLEQAQLAAWASALHITEAQLIEAVAMVGCSAREVIPYVLGRSVDGRGPSAQGARTLSAPSAPLSN